MVQQAALQGAHRVVSGGGRKRNNPLGQSARLRTRPCHRVAVDAQPSHVALSPVSYDDVAAKALRTTTRM